MFRSLLVLALGLLVAIGCDFPLNVDGKMTIGDGEAGSEQRSVGTFTGVRVGGAIKAVLTKGEPGKITVKADKNLLPIIETKIENGVLVISTKGSVTTKNDLVVEATVSDLNLIDANGAASVMAQDLDLGPVTVKGSGASSIVIQGTAKGANLDLSGASKANFVLTGGDLDADLSGASRLTVSGTAKTTRVKLTGASHLEAESLDVTRGRITAKGASHGNIKDRTVLDVDRSGASMVK